MFYKLRLISINIFVFILFLISLEIGLRTIRTVRDCIHENCNLSHYKINQQTVWFGISKPNSQLGFETKSNLDKIINYKGWENVKLSTDAYGLRNSGHLDGKFNQRLKILTVGDSFTFGDQVSDHETWQYCLNNVQINYLFLNGGVPGYGTAQSLLRGKILIKKIEPEYLLISTLVGHDFARDQLSYRTGFPMSPVSKKDGKLFHTKNINPDVIGSKFYKGKYKANILIKIIASSELIRKYFPQLARKEIEYLQSNLFEKNINSPSKEEIIQWTINNSRNLEIPVIWLLQYSATLNNAFLDERKNIINQLKFNKIPYIDSFNILHGDDINHSLKNKIWINKNHHSPLGNKLICDLIKENIHLIKEVKN